MTDVDITGKCWIKLGNINVHPIPADVFKYPIREGNSHFRDIARIGDDNNFWFKRSFATLLTLTDERPTEYLRALHLPSFSFRSICFLSMVETHGWHSDVARVASINIALKNGNSARVEFEDGSNYIMEDGDIYCLDVTKRHRIVIDGVLTDPRILLSVGLLEGFSSQSTREIIRSIMGHKPLMANS